MNGRVSALLELGEGFDPLYTGRENAYMNGSIMNISRKEMDRKIDKVRDFADIGEFFDRPIWMYSSGMAARLAFAVAVNMEPDVLIVDEVLSVGDLAFQRKCNDHMAELKKKEVTILYVSHSLPTVENLCSRAILLEEGRSIMIGPSSEVVRHYQSEFEDRRFIPSEAILQDFSKTFSGKGHDRAALEEYYAQLEDQRIELNDVEKHPFQTGEVEFREILFLNENDEPSTLFKCSDRMKVRVKYVAKRMIRDPIFSVGLFNSKGIHCYGIRTVNGGVLEEDVRIDEIEGEGSFEADLGEIRLNSDTYMVSIAVFDQLFSTPYALSRSLKIQVKADSWNSNAGLNAPIMMAKTHWHFS